MPVLGPTASDSQNSDTENRNSQAKSDFVMEKSKSNPNSERLPEFRMANTISYSYWKKVEDDLRLEGRAFRTGQFSHAENLQLKHNWKKLIKKVPLGEPQLLLRKTVRPEYSSIIKNFIAENDFYIRLGHKINRSPYTVYVRARKLFNFSEKTGEYTEEEEKKLKDLERKCGKKWEEIGRVMGRSGHSACKKASTLEKNVDRGRWTDAENRQLEAGVAEVMKLKDNNGDSTQDTYKMFFKMPWVKIAEYVPTRNSKQCRERWILHQQNNQAKKWKKRNKTFDNAERMKLLKEIKSLTATDEAGIDWEYIHSKFPETPSPQYLKQKWYNLKKTVLDYKVKPLDKILTDCFKKVSSETMKSDTKKDDYTIENHTDDGESVDDVTSTYNGNKTAVNKLFDVNSDIVEILKHDKVEYNKSKKRKRQSEDFAMDSQEKSEIVETSKLAKKRKTKAHENAEHAPSTYNDDKTDIKEKPRDTNLDTEETDTFEKKKSKKKKKRHMNDFSADGQDEVVVSDTSKLAEEKRETKLDKNAEDSASNCMGDEATVKEIDTVEAPRLDIIEEKKSKKRKKHSDDPTTNRKDEPESPDPSSLVKKKRKLHHS